jgi:competence protein ComEA
MRFSVAIIAALLVAPIACMSANAAPPNTPAAPPAAAAPLKQAAPTTAAAPTAAAPAATAPAATCAKVNVNAASVDELDTLPGIGPARAADIIKGRPYIDQKELMSKGGLSQSVFDGLKACAALVDFNNTPADQIQAVLDGVGEARAAAIVKGRPYAKAADVVAKAGIPQATFDKFAHEVMVSPVKKK